MTLEWGRTKVCLGHVQEGVGGVVLTPLLSVSAIKRRSKMEQELEEEMGQARVACDGGDAATLQACLAELSSARKGSQTGSGTRSSV